MADRNRYLQLLEEQADRSDCAVHAYVLMSNHIHLLVTPRTRLGVPAMMKQIGQRYVQFVNAKYSRCGTLWDGRYRSSITQSNEYVLACYRYIELNPVRASMVDHPSRYPWSSYRFNGGGEQSSLITPHPTFVELGETADERRQNYISLFDDRLDESTIEEFRAGAKANLPTGEQRFKEKLAMQLNRRVTPGKRGRRWP